MLLSQKKTLDDLVTAFFFASRGARLVKLVGLAILRYSPTSNVTSRP